MILLLIGSLLDIGNWATPTQSDIQALISKTLREVTESESKLGPLGVDSGAQKLFDALAKGCTCAWRGRNIVVFGEVVIEPPYTKVGI